MADDIFIGGKQLSNPRNAQVQADTDAPLPDTGTAVSNPIPNYYGSGPQRSSVYPGDPEATENLADRGAPRDMENWANQHGEADKLMNDKEAWDEEDFNMRGLEKSKLRPIAHKTVLGTPKGLIEPGNINLNDRPSIRNADGTHSSEYSVSFADDKGREILVPTIVNGKFLTPDGTKPPEGSAAEKEMFARAREHYENTHEHMGIFSSPQAADAYATDVHNRSKIVAAPDGSTVAFPKDMSNNDIHHEMASWWDQHVRKAYEVVGNLIPEGATPALEAGMNYYVNPVNKALGKVGDVAQASVQSPLANLSPKTKAYLRSQGVDPEGPMPAWAKGVNDETIRFAAQTMADPRMWPFFAEKFAVEAPTVARAILGRALSGAVATDASTTAVQGLKDLHDNWASMTPEQRSQQLTGATLSTLMAGLSGYHAAAGSPVAPTEEEKAAYSGPERRAEARKLMSPTEIEAAMKNRRLNDIQTPFDTTEGASETMNRDIAARLAEKPTPQPVAVNASGESAASQEAINRVASQRAQGIKTYRVDSRSGNAIPVLGVDAVDATAKPYEHIVQVKDGQVQIQDSGKGARPLNEPKLLQQVTPQTVGTSEGAAQDSALYAEAKAKLGPDASFSQIAQEAQKMKTGGKSQIARAADAFNEENGRLPVKHVEAQPSANAKQIADEYDKMVHNPNDPVVQKSYAAMKSDIDDQWDFATHKMGMDMEPWTAEGQPYKNSKEMAADVRNNHHLYFFQGGDMPADHPLAEDAGNGLTYNDKLRAVHDLFGHATNENQFGPAGEERAWREHRQMFSPEAIPAVTTETRGQNSWVNFGAHLRNAEGNIPAKGEPGAIHPADRPFAEQKAGILPEWTHTPEGSPEDTKVAADTLAHIGSGKNYAILTAENPHNTRISDEENASRNAELEKELRSKGYEPVAVEGHNQDVQGNTEHSLFVPGISPEEAASIGHKYGQAAVLTTEGLHDLDQQTIMKSDNKNILTGDDARKQPYYSTVGGKPFSVPLGDAEPRTATWKDLWHDETGTYTSGRFMRYLAKNNLMTKAGQETLKDAASQNVVPGWEEVSKFLTPEDRQEVTKRTQQNVVNLVNSFNPEWIEEAAKAGSVAKGWYARATALIQHIMGDDAHRFTNFVASLSPQKDVEQNLTDALNFYNMWQAAGKPTGPENEKVIRDLTERAETGMSGQVARDQLYANLVNDVQPTGPKVSNFARNLKGNMDAVTKDRWVAYLFGNNDQMFRWFKEGESKPAAHLAADALIRAVGQSIGMLPAEVQETAWSFLRTVINLAEKEKISTKQAVNNITEQHIREGASELTRLIADSPKVQSALNQLATATGDKRFGASAIQDSPEFKRLLQEHKEQAPTAGGLGAANRATLARGVKKSVEARSSLTEAKNAKAAASAAKPEKSAPKKAPKDKATEFNPHELGSNITPAIRESMKSALA